MSLIIHRDDDNNRWSVYRTGEFARYVTSFPTLHEAELFITRGECPDEIESA